MVQKRKLKLKSSARKPLIIVGAFILVIIIIVSFYFNRVGELKSLGYSEEAANSIIFKFKYSYIVDLPFNKTLNAAFESDDYIEDNLDNYAKIDNRVKVFHKQNGGVSSARNLGLDNVKGKWVTFCDSDDYVSPEWLDIYIRNCRNNVELIVQSFNNKSVVNNYFEGCTADFIDIFYDFSIIGYIWNKLFLASIIKSKLSKLNTMSGST